jgi:hypothetical protein
VSAVDSADVADIASTPVGQAVLQAAVERRVGLPVYLRHAVETAAGADLVEWGAQAVHYAAQVLGTVQDVYAAGVAGLDGGWVHLALTLRHEGGAVALVGVGRQQAPAPGPTTGPRGLPSSILLLGDQGAVDGNPAMSAPAGAAPTTAPAAESATPRAALAAYAQAIHRSLASGRPEAPADPGDRAAAGGE